MRIVFLTGSHPRHQFMARTLAKTGWLRGLLVEERAPFVPAPPEGLTGIDLDNFKRHFKEREEAELRHFGRPDESIFSEVEHRRIKPSELNSPSVANWIKSLEPDVVITYGVHKIRADVLNQLPDIRWNIHGGLSPWFRGSITMFWPFYMLRPNWTGMTLHYLSPKLDGGDIVHHSVPTLEYGDGIHDVACKAVRQMAEDLTRILELHAVGQPLPKEPQRTAGKLFLASDWTPQTLRLIYQTFNNDIVDAYLDGVLEAPEPALVRAF